MANLLSNAGKHTPPGSTVGVALAAASAAADGGEAAADPGAPGAQHPGDTTVQRGVLPPDRGSS